MSLFRPNHEKRIASLSAAELILANGGRYGSRSYSGVPVNDDTALRLAAVWGCVDLISELLSTLPIDEYRRGSSDELIPQTRPPLLDDPAGEGYGFEVWCRQIMVSLLMRGNSYGWIESVGADGWPTQIASLHPDEIKPRRDYMAGPVEWYRDNKRVQRWPQGPLWHVPAYTVPGSPIGLSPIQYAAETIGVGLAAQKFGAQWFGDGAHPSSVFESPLEINKEQAEVIKERIKTATYDNREPLVLGMGGHLEAIQVTPNESQFLETIKANADDVARFFFRRPPGEGGQVTYANVEARSLDLLTYTLNGWMVRIEKALTRIRPRPRFVKFNADALIRVDLTSRYAAHASAIRAGWQSVNDVRHTEDLPAVPDGNEYLWPPYTVTEPAPTDAGGASDGSTQPP